MERRNSWRWQAGGPLAALAEELGHERIGQGRYIMAQSGEKDPTGAVMADPCYGMGPTVHAGGGLRQHANRRCALEACVQFIVGDKVCQTAGHGMVGIGDFDGERAAGIMLGPAGTAAVPDAAQQFHECGPLAVPGAAGEVHAGQAAAAFDETAKIFPGLWPGPGLFPVHEMQHDESVALQPGCGQVLRVFGDADLETGIGFQDVSKHGGGLAPRMSGMVLAGDEQHRDGIRAEREGGEDGAEGHDGPDKVNRPRRSPEWMAIPLG